MANTELRLGLIGCGGIAPVHLDSYRQDGRLSVAAAGDVEELRAEALAAQRGQIQLFCRRPPPDANPPFTRLDGEPIIHSERLDGGSAGRRLTLNPHPILTPSEVFAPRLRAGIEQRHLGPRRRVDSRRAEALASVAAAATQPKIVFLRPAPEHFRNQVFHLHRGPGQRFRCQTIATAMKGLTGNQPP